MLKIASLLLILYNLCSATIVNLNVTRTVDVLKPVVKSQIEIIFQNQGPNILKNYEFYIEPQVKVFYAECFDVKDNALQYKQQYDEKTSSYVLNIELLKRLGQFDIAKIYVDLYFMNVLEPIPKVKPMKQPQLFEYQTVANFYSAYQTKFSETSFKWSSKDHDVETFQFENLGPFVVNKTEFIFENNKLMLQVTSLERIIDVSHFGRISISENIVLRRLGSRAIGSFGIEGDDYSAQKYWILTRLPMSSEDIKLYDDIGYIFTTHTKEGLSDILFKYKTRYPLLADWKSSHSLKYSVPSYDYLTHNKKGTYQLDILAVDHVVTGASIDNAIVKIILPEGSNIKEVINLPQSISRVDDEKVHTMLTTFARPTVVLTGKDLIEMHMTSVTVVYELSQFYMLKTPLVVSAYIFAMFLITIVYNRLDLSLK